MRCRIRCIVWKKEGLELNFTKYAVRDGKDQYWLKLTHRADETDKLLHFIYLDIDGEKTRLVAEKPTYEQATASVGSLQTFAYGAGLFGSEVATIERPNMRYFNLDDSLRAKLQNAKSVALYYNTMRHLGKKFTFNAEYLQAIKDNFKPEFADFEAYSKWHPDMEGKGKDYQLKDAGVFGEPGK